MSRAGIERMIVEAARRVEPGSLVFAGVGIPVIAMAVAKKFYHQDITILCEAGVVDTMPSQLALSIADPSLVRSSKGLFTPNEIFSYFLQGGLIDVGVIGGAQVDRYGNVNSTVIGSYDSPKVRMPGSGGACEIASNSKSTMIITPQGKRRFVEKVDFITSPGHVPQRADGTLIGGGPKYCVTDLGLYAFDEDSKEMYLMGLYEGVTIEDIKENTGWDIRIAEDLQLLAAPTQEEIDFISQLDPKGIFLGKAG